MPFLMHEGRKATFMSEPTLQEVASILENDDARGALMVTETHNNTESSLNSIHHRSKI